MNPYGLFRTLAFQMDAEKAHEATIKFMSTFPKVGKLISPFNLATDKKDNPYQTTCFGLTCPFPVALAAGLDKNAEAVEFLSHLPFGAIEVGTVTPRPQQGNPRPRMFRLKEQQGLRNHLGFNNHGAQRVLKRLQQLKAKPLSCPIGVNLGKNKDTPNAQAIEDYQYLFRTFADVADYLVVNLSSPNTASLRDLQDDAFLKELSQVAPKETPVAIKISPDMERAKVQSLVESMMALGFAGVVATNTTNDHPDLGGLSGGPLKEKSKRVRQWVLEVARGQSHFDVVGVGGFSKREDFHEFWEQGGALAQVYSSFIFQGPALFKEIFPQ